MEGNQTGHLLLKNNSGEFALASRGARWFHRSLDRESASEEGSPAIRPAPCYNGSHARDFLLGSLCGTFPGLFATDNRQGS